MKKYAGFLIGISCALGSMIFCSCGKNDKTENINEITEQTAQELEQIDDNEAISGQKKENDKSELSENAEKTKEQNSSVEPVETKVDNTYMGDLTPSEGLEFESNGDGTCAIKSVGTFEGDDLIIPQTSPGGDTVTEISEDAFYRLECDYIVFDTVTMAVNDSAFSSSDYKNLVINNSNLTIGENAFAYNDKAESVTILNSECSFDEYALYNTGKHMKIGITDSTIMMEDSAVSGSNEDILLVYNSKIDMGSNAFAYSDDITDVKFKNCEITMDEYTFYATGDSASVVFDECDITMQDEEFIEELRGERFDVDTKSLICTRRCSEEICSFIRDKLGIQIQSARINAGTVIRPSNIQEILDDKNIVKLVYDNASHYSFRAVNWSYSKGDTYDAVCVILNGSTEKLVEDKFSVSTLKTVTLNKLYVALTRSKGDLYIVTQDEFETVKEKYYNH